MARTHFEVQLDELTGRLVAMSRMIEGLIETSLEAVQELDANKASAVIMGDREHIALRHLDCHRHLPLRIRPAIPPPVHRPIGGTG